MDQKAKHRLFWGAAATLMAIILSSSFGGIILFAALDFLTGLTIFMWLWYVSIVICIAAIVGGVIVTIRDFLRQKRTRKQNKQAGI